MADGEPPWPGPPDRPPSDSEPPPAGPVARKGLSTGCTVALTIVVVFVAVILLAFGICVAIINSSGSG